MLQKDVDAVAEHGGGCADGAGGELKYRGGLDADGGYPPGLQIFFQVDDVAIPVEVDGVDCETHGEGVNAVRGIDPESAAGWEGRAVGGHESAKPRPVRARDDEIGGEIGGAGAVEGVGGGMGHLIIESLNH